MYKLAPYRLFLVVAGSFVAFIWTVFPVQVNEGSIIRQNTGESLFLLAEYFGSVMTTVNENFKMRHNLAQQSGAGSRLEKVRRRLLGRQITLLNSMHQNLIDVSWEPRAGGRFPKETYEAIIKEIQRWLTPRACVTLYVLTKISVTQHLGIISHAAQLLSNKPNEQSSTFEEHSIYALRASLNRLAHDSTTLLVLFSASIRNKTALPPNLFVPRCWHDTGSVRSHELGKEVVAATGVKGPRPHWGKIALMMRQLDL